MLSGPPPVSLWSVVRGHKVDPYAYWSAIRERHGDVSRYRFALRDSFFISSPEGAKRILAQRFTPRFARSAVRR